MSTRANLKRKYLLLEDMLFESCSAYKNKPINILTPLHERDSGSSIKFIQLQELKIKDSSHPVSSVWPSDP